MSHRFFNFTASERRTDDDTGKLSGRDRGNARAVWSTAGGHPAMQPTMALSSPATPVRPGGSLAQKFHAAQVDAGELMAMAARGPMSVAQHVKELEACGAAELTPEDLQLCRAMGLSPARFLEQRLSERASAIGR